MLVLFIALTGAALAQGGNPVLTPQVLKEAGKEAGTPWTFVFRYPVAATVGDFNRQVQQLAQQQLTAFKKYLVELGPRPNAPPYKSVFEAKYTVVTDRPGCISIHWEASSFYAAGAHPSAFPLTTTWLAPLGPVQLPDLFKPNTDWLQTISRLAVKFMKGKGATEIGLEDVGPKAENFHAFALTKAGLRIYFSQGQALSTADGTHELLVPWSALQTALKPEVAAQISKL